MVARGYEKYTTQETSASLRHTCITTTIVENNTGVSRMMQDFSSGNFQYHPSSVIML